MSNRDHLHTPRNPGDKVADIAVGAMGSWKFILIQSAILALWIVLNTVGFIHHWDGAPFILLNLCLSFQAAFTGPIVLLSQNRQATRDRGRDDIESEEVSQMLTINQQQLTILHRQDEILQLIHAANGVK